MTHNQVNNKKFVLLLCEVKLIEHANNTIISVHM